MPNLMRGQEEIKRRRLYLTMRDETGSRHGDRAVVLRDGHDPIYLKQEMGEITVDVLGQNPIGLRYIP